MSRQKQIPVGPVPVPVVPDLTQLEAELGRILSESCELGDLARTVRMVLDGLAYNVIDAKHVSEMLPGLAVMASDIERRAHALSGLASITDDKVSSWTLLGGDR